LSLAGHARGPDWRWDRFEFARDGEHIDFTLYRYPIIAEARRDGLEAVLGTPAPGTVVLTKGHIAREMGIEDDPGWDNVGNGVYVRAF
jgi:hypothetical protein